MLVTAAGTPVLVTASTAVCLNYYTAEPSPTVSVPDQTGTAEPPTESAAGNVL